MLYISEKIIFLPTAATRCWKCLSYRYFMNSSSYPISAGIFVCLDLAQFMFMQAQLLWVHVCNGLAMSWKACFSAVTGYFCLLLFFFFFWPFLPLWSVNIWAEGYNTDVPSKAELSPVLILCRMTAGPCIHWHLLKKEASLMTAESFIKGTKSELRGRFFFNNVCLEE